MLEILLAGVAVVGMGVTVLVVPMDRIAYVATAAFVLFVTWNGFRLGAGGALNNVFLVFAMAAVLANVVLIRQAIRVPPWLLVATGGFVLAAMVNVIFPPDYHWINETLLSYRTDFAPPPPGPLAPRSDLMTLVEFLVAVALIPIMLTLAAPTVRRVKGLIDVFVVSCAANAAVGIVDYAGLHIAPTGARVGREAGLTLHPNYLALTCTIGIPLALLWVSRGGRWRTAGLVALALLLGGTLVAGGRAGAISAPLALIVTVAAIPRLRRGLGFVLPVAGVCIAGLLAFTSVGNEVLEQVRFSGDPTTTGSDNAREELAGLAVDQFTARPLQGIGFQVIQDAHSIYLQLLAAGGLIALAAFLTYIWGLWDCVRRVRAGPERDVATAAGIAVLMWLVNGAIDSQLADKYLYVIPGLLVALAYATAAATAKPEPKPASTVPPAKPAAPAEPLPAPSPEIVHAAG